MRLALRLARKGYGQTSPNPMVGALLVRHHRKLGQGWHRRAGAPHAEIEALIQARQHGFKPSGATLYVTLEPCSTQGRTPPCTEAIRAAGIRRVVVGAVDPNPKHAGRGLDLLSHAGIAVTSGILESECAALNEAFNHWIVQRTPFVTVKAAMTLDGKIATAGGQSKWITGERARAHAQRLRHGHDAILVGIQTLLADDPRLTLRPANARTTQAAPSRGKIPRRIILDSRARTPLQSRVVANDPSHATTIVVGPNAPAKRVKALAKKVNVLLAPAEHGRIELAWLLDRLGAEQVTSLLVEGGGEVQASFLLGGFAHRVAFYYAPKILGGHDDRKAVAGPGARNWNELLKLTDPHWRRLGPDLFLTARVQPPAAEEKPQTR
ncbi:MAG: bifunctional diaminohydroxyphosphoribosylaminopyrimidine deaminase/5-amino-6-(5-phosphoribosylamino)uracil reductase RibD [Verrucomicrobia bacterium]|nr:bifunctional diaminohydroxyphosphoribosylaminopyrimidine deaminase/5-amino-6-(5-phosphoribosylamino)uracil reductase RibD [Verrucomicrobiota bacterium]